jgi:prepilin-type N-terminal cleavage/methylation domain-containing protein
MFFNPKTSKRQGFTLMEFLFAVGISAIAILAVVGFSVFGSRSLAALYSSCSMDQQNRKTIDQLTKDLRNVMAITNSSTNKFICQDYDTNALTYIYDSTAQTLTRIKGARTNVLLTDCSRLTFTYGMRLLSNGTFSVYPAAGYYDTKTVTAEWCCVKKIMGRAFDDMPQYTTINIRTKN